MKSINELRLNPKLIIDQEAEDGGCGHIFFGVSKYPAIIIFSWGDGWDHVSISYKNRCCTWEEMCYIKDTFFREDECVIQYHPAKKDYVNIHPYVLHLWRSQSEGIPVPPKYMV